MPVHDLDMPSSTDASVRLKMTIQQHVTIFSSEFAIGPGTACLLAVRCTNLNLQNILDCQMEGIFRGGMLGGAPGRLRLLTPAAISIQRVRTCIIWSLQGMVCAFTAATCWKDQYSMLRITETHSLKWSPPLQCRAAMARLSGTRMALASIPGCLRHMSKAQTHSSMCHISEHVDMPTMLHASVQ